MDKFAFIVEDDDMLADFFAEALLSVGYENERAANGQMAMDRLASLTPSLLILDLNLPNVSGEKLLEFIRTQSHLSEMRILATSTDGTRVGFLDGLVDLTLVKPVSYRQLITLVKRIETQPTQRI